MFINLKYCTFTNKLFDVVAHARPIEISLCMLHCFVMARVASRGIEMDKGQQLLLKRGAFDNP